MRISIPLVIIAALVGALLVWVVGSALFQPDLPLLGEASFSNTLLTPNADGTDDVTTFAYRLNANAQVSLRFVGEDGSEYWFRQNETRTVGDYSVLFSGVVNGYMVPGEEIAGTVERRLIPDGEYRWFLEAQNESEQQTIEGTLTIQDADSPLPLMTVFTVSPSVFTPNQDSIDDRVEVNVFLEKEADLRVFLIDENQDQLPISARKEGRKPGEAGRHIFEYEGGVDLGADPPEDGTYTVVALAQDDEGQRIRRETTLTIVDGGNPLAEIVPQTVGGDVLFGTMPYAETFYATRDQEGELLQLPDLEDSPLVTTISLPIGDMLVFMLTVENYSEVPIRTTGPPPGTVYDQDQLPATLGWVDESGAWRIGIECQTSMTPFPYRWAIGSADVLVTQEDPDNGQLYWYLPPGERSIVWGAVRFTEIDGRNPQDCWAGLIHEDVGISLRNNNVGRRTLQLIPFESSDLDG